MHYQKTSNAKSKPKEASTKIIAAPLGCSKQGDVVIIKTTLTTSEVEKAIKKAEEAKRCEF